MADVVIDTGMEGLDDDLRVLFELCASDAKLAESQRALNDRSLSTQELLKRVPEAVIRLSLLQRPAIFESVANSVKDESRAALEQAKRLIAEHFSQAMSHPALRRYVRAMQTQDGKISAIGYESSWTGDPPQFHPRVRLEFRDPQMNLLLDSTLAWDDLAFVSASLVEILAEQLQKARELVARDQIQLPERTALATRLRDLESGLKQIKDLAPEYGIVLEPEPDASATA